jgi:rhodanese-related sulfurtransferase
MKLIGREELKAKLDRGDDFKLVMTLGEWAFQLSHIPGSLNVSSFEQARELLSPVDKDEEIVVYCSDANCIASQAAYRFLTENGYSNVRRYAGGLSDWQMAGYPLEGMAHE